MLRATGYLWIVAALAFYYAFVNTHVPDPDQDIISEVLDLLNPQVSYDELAAWCVSAFLFSGMYALWHWKKWRGETWLALLTWSCSLGAFAGWASTVEWMPRAGNDFDFLVWLTPDYNVLSGWPAKLLDLSNWITVALFLVVLSLFPRDDDGLPIGGRWHPVWALALGGLVAFLVNRFNPIGIYYELVYEFSADEIDPTLWSALFDLLVAWVATVLPLFSAFAVMAWKTRASLSLTDERIVARLGKGLDVFRIRWSTVLRTTEVVVKHERQSIIIEHGVLPWYRLRFGLHKRRDGAATIEKVWQHAPSKSRTEVRRGTILTGSILLLASAVCILFVQRTMYSSSALMASSDGDFVEIFVASNHFLLFGWLMMCAGLFLGTGLGMLFAPNYASIRPLPLLGVVVCALVMPSPIIYWLVYIAMYAILTARLGPAEPIPHVPFPDLRVAEFGFWAADSTALFAVIGYVIGTMIVLKPWTRFLPSWPYQLPVFGPRPKESPDLSNPEQSPVEDA